MIVHVLLAAAAASVAHLCWKVVRSWWIHRDRVMKLAATPGPPQRFGAEITANMHRLNDWRREDLAKYGKGSGSVRFLDLFDVEVVVTSQENIRHVLKDNFRNYTKFSRAEDYATKMMEEWLGAAGIFLLRHGDQPANVVAHNRWYDQRKTAAVIFTKSNFQGFWLETFTAKAARLVEVLRAEAPSLVPSPPRLRSVLEEPRLRQPLVSSVELGHRQPAVRQAVDGRRRGPEVIVHGISAERGPLPPSADGAVIPCELPHEGERLGIVRLRLPHPPAASPLEERSAGGRGGKHLDPREGGAELGRVSGRAHTLLD